jgi:hypothetical protein
MEERAGERRRVRVEAGVIFLHIRPSFPRPSPAPSSPAREKSFAPVRKYARLEVQSHIP